MDYIKHRISIIRSRFKRKGQRILSLILAMLLLLPNIVSFTYADEMNDPNKFYEAYTEGTEEPWSYGYDNSTVNWYRVKKDPISITDSYTPPYSNANKNKDDLVAYCFNAKRLRPNTQHYYTEKSDYSNPMYESYSKSGTSEHTHYTRTTDVLGFLKGLDFQTDDEAKVFISYNTRTGEGVPYDPSGREQEQAEIFRKNLLKVLYNGFGGDPDASKKMQGTASDRSFRMATQRAVYFFVNGATFENSEHYYTDVNYEDVDDLFEALISGEGEDPPAGQSLYLYMLNTEDDTYTGKSGNHPRYYGKTYQNLVAADFYDLPGHQVKFGKYTFGTVDGDEALVGAQVSVTNVNTNKVISEWTSDGSDQIVYLEAGNYVFKESSAPEGYLKVPDIFFTVDNNGKVTVTSVDGRAEAEYDDVVKVTSEGLTIYDKERDFQVRKSWAEGMEPKPVTLELLKDGQPTGQTVLLDGTETPVPWTHTWTGLDDDEAYQYSVREVNEEYESEDLGFQPYTYTYTVSTVVPGQPEYADVTSFQKTSASYLKNGQKIVLVESAEASDSGYYLREGKTGYAIRKSGNDLDWSLDALQITGDKITSNTDGLEFTVEDLSNGEFYLKSGNSYLYKTKDDFVGFTPHKTSSNHKPSASKFILTSGGQLQLADGSRVLGYWNNHTGRGTERFVMIKKSKMTGTWTNTYFSVYAKTTERVKISESNDEIREEEVSVSGVYYTLHNIGTKTNAPKVTFNKFAMDTSELLAGANLKLTREDGSQVLSWTTGRAGKKISLEAGSYVLEETAAPEGYNKVPKIHFSVDEEGKVTITEVEGFSGSDYSHLVTVDNDNVLNICDPALPKVTFNKFALDTGDVLAGANLKLTREDGSSVQSWTTGTAGRIISLEAGSYVLEETAAPQGHTTVPKIHFTVDEEGKVTITEVEGFSGSDYSHLVTVDNDNVINICDPAEVDKKEVEVIKTWDKTYAGEKPSIQVGLYHGDQLVTGEGITNPVTLNGSESPTPWYYKWTGLDPDITYTVREIVPDGANYYPVEGTTTVQYREDRIPGTSSSQTLTNVTNMASIANGTEIVLVNRNNSNKMLGSNASLTTTAPINGTTGTVANSNIWIVANYNSSQQYFTLYNKESEQYLYYKVSGGNYVLTTSSEHASTIRFNSSKFQIYIQNLRNYYYLDNSTSSIKFTSTSTTSDYRFYKVTTTPGTDDTFTEVEQTRFNITNYPKQQGELTTIISADGNPSSTAKSVSIEVDAAGSDVSVTDTVSYQGLVAGEKYTVISELYEVLADGTVDASNPKARKEAELTAEATEGTWTIDFGTVKLEPGKKYVAYETAVSVNNLIDENGDSVPDAKQTVEHRNPSDIAQTIVTTLPETVDVEVTKDWSKNFDESEKRPVEVILYKDGGEYDRVTLTADDNWYYKWTDLPKNAVYTVDEVVPEEMENVWIKTIEDLNVKVTEKRNYNFESMGNGRKMTYQDENRKTVDVLSWAACINQTYLDPAGQKNIEYLIREGAGYSDVKPLIKDQNLSPEAYLRLQRVTYYFVRNYASGDKTFNGSIFSNYQRVVWNITDDYNINTYWKDTEKYSGFRDFYLVSYGLSPDSEAETIAEVKDMGNGNKIPDKLYEVSDEEIRNTLRITTLETDQMGKKNVWDDEETPYQNLLHAEIVEPESGSANVMKFTIHNDKVRTFTLPDTGGVLWRTGLTVGMLCILFACAGYVLYRRKRIYQAVFFRR